MKAKKLTFGTLSFNHKTINYAILLPLVLISITIVLGFFSHNIYPLPERIILLSQTITFILLTIISAGIIAKITVARIMSKFDESLEPEQKILASKLYVSLIYGTAFVIIFWQIGITLSSIALFLTLFATGLAFAIRDVIISYIAWYILLTKKPFRIGDHIKIDDYEGKVQHIGTFYVIVDESPETFEDIVRIPNKLFLEKPIRVFGKSDYENVLEIPLTAIPDNFEEKRREAERKIEEVLGRKQNVYLNANKEKYFIKVHYTCKYDERNSVKDRLLTIISQEIK